MINIDFNQLIRNYDQDLLNDLRGFGKNNDYLKYWVPGTTRFKSFINLLDALVETDILDFNIKLNPNDLDLKKVDEVVSKVANSYKIEEFDQNFFYKIEIEKKRYTEFKQVKVIHKNSLIKDNIDYKENVSFEIPSEDLVDTYLENLNQIKCKNYKSENQIHEKKDTFVGNIKDLVLELKIKANLIENINHNGSSDPTLEKFIDVFGDIIINKSIQEASEHGVIYLEEKIRMINNKLIKKGIILPHLAGNNFVLLNNLIRSIEKKYNKKNNYITEINKSYFKISDEWKNLSLDEKKNKIMEIIREKFIDKNIFKEGSVKINKIDNEFKIYLDIDKNFRAIQEKRNVLLELEHNLKKLDQTLEIFIEEIIDKNKLRLKNSPQNIL